MPAALREHTRAWPSFPLTRAEAARENSTSMASIASREYIFLFYQTLPVPAGFVEPCRGNFPILTELTNGYRDVINERYGYKNIGEMGERVKVLEIRSFEDVLHHKEFKRFLRFLVVGVSGTALDFLILTALKTFFGVPTLLANTVSYSCGVINNFTLNRLWTFSESRDKHWLVQFGQFVLINLVALGLNNLIVVGLEHPLDLLLHTSKGFLVAKVIATAVVVIWNFIANRLWTFRGVSKQI